MAYRSKPDTAWLCEPITTNQKGMIEKIVNTKRSLVPESLEVKDKYDAWNFIDKHIHVLNEKKEEPVESPISAQQQEDIEYISKHLKHPLFTGTTFQEADTYIRQYFSKAREMKKKEEQKSNCLYCNKKASYYNPFSSTEQGQQLTLCSEHYDIERDKAREKKKELTCKHCDEIAEYYDIHNNIAGDQKSLCQKHYEEQKQGEYSRPGVYVKAEEPEVEFIRICGECEDEIRGRHFTDLRKGSTYLRDLCHSCYTKISQTDEYRNIGREERPIAFIESAIGKFQLKETPASTKPKEENKMMSKLKGLLGEFGKDTSGRFKLSFQGLAVKSGNSFVVFNGEDVTDVMDFVLPKSEDMIFKMPATIDQLAKGDVILNKDRILFVRALSKKGIIAIDPITNDEVTHIPVKNMFGFQFYTKVVSLMNFGQQAGTQQAFNPMMLMLMSGESDGESSKLEDLLPLMMMSGQLGGAQGSNPLQQMLPLMMMSGKDEGSNDMMSMMMMSQMFGGGAQANPFGALFGQPVVPVTEDKDEA